MAKDVLVIVKGEIIKRVATLFLLTLSALTLVGCVAATTGGSSSSSSKPSLGVTLEQPSSSSTVEYSGIRLDVVVPVFEPGIPNDPDDYEKLGIWPEVRRTEAIRFASMLKTALQETKALGDVVVTQDTTVSSDLYVLGQINKSNGEDVEIDVSLYDSSQRKLMSKTFKHRVEEYHWDDVRQQGKDPYYPVFEKAAKEIVKSLKKKSPEYLERVRAITELNFARVFVPNAFSEHLEFKDKKFNLVSLPAEEDPMLQRTRSLAVVDKLYLNKSQEYYEDFIQNTDDSYTAWQEFSLSSAKSMRKAKSQATVNAILGGLLLIAGAAASDEDQDVVSTAAVVGGAMMLQNSFSANKEGKYHRENLNELGRDLNFDLAPQVVQLENDNITLKGNVTEQYLQWRELLKQMFEQEGTPNVQL